MKYSCLFALFLFYSSELNAQQQDSLLQTDSLAKTVVTDSTVVTPPFTVTLDTSRIIWSGWHGEPFIFNPDWSKLIVVESPYTPKGARHDIKNGKPFIIFSGGIVSHVHDSDKAFEKKYGVTFYTQGCVRLTGENPEGYNQVIFDYLDQRYGKAWRYELNQEAIGFEAPIDSITKPTFMFQPKVPSSAKTTKKHQPESGSGWLYILSAGGFAIVLLSLYLFKKRKK